MTVDKLPTSIREMYEIHEWRHASAILERDFPNEWNDIILVLSGFRLKRSDILTPGGGKSLFAQGIDGAFQALGWREKAFEWRRRLPGIGLWHQ